MIGTTIEARPPVPWPSIVFAVGCIAFVATGAISGRPAFLAIGILLGAIAAVLFLSRESAFRAEITHDSLLLHHRGASVRYADLISIATQPNDRFSEPSRCPLIITHSDGVLEVPADANVPSDELAQFLRGRLPPRIVSVPDPDIADYLQRQLSQFDSDQIFWCQAGLAAPPTMRRSTRRAWIVCFLVGIALIFIGMAVLSAESPRGGGRARDDRATQWFAVGTVAIVVGAFGWMLHAAMGRGTNPKIKDAALSSLVISPAGMALRQGDLKGELRWAEIRGAQLGKRPPLKLQLAGAMIPIFNVYDRPLAEIHERIRHHLP